LDLPFAHLRIVQTASELATELEQHVFVTLDHEVAPATLDCVLVTADERYLCKAKRVGCVGG
jgi:hypothetical protein